MAKNNKEDIKFEIKEHFCDMGTRSEKGWVTELNLVSWNDSEPKYDIRGWQDPQTEEAKMLKGITLTREEVIKLKEALNNIEL